MVQTPPVKDSTGDHRRAPRIPWLAEVMVRGCQVSSFGAAQNLSEGGLFMKTRAPFERGQVLWLVMQIDGLVLEALAEIVHGDATTGYGVKFVVVDPAGKQRLRHFVTAAAHAVGRGLVN